ncbi:hypothetical protein JCM8547_005703 [Rhodosporidiobolus lusitaniae]
MATLTQSGTERARLLEHLVYQHFGSAVGEVASILLARGALSFPQLTKLTSLTPPSVHASLLVLSIHCLVFHSDTEVNGRITELYELNHTSVERRLRGGMYTQMGEEWEGGSELGAMIQTMLLHGMLPAVDLKHAVEGKLMEKEDVFELEDPKGKKRARAEEQREQAADLLIRRAFAKGFISLVTPGSQTSPSSLEIKWEEEIRLTIKGIPTTKDLQEVKRALKQKKQEYTEQEREFAKGKGLDATVDDDSDDEPKRKRRKKKRKGQPDSDSSDSDEDQLQLKKEDPALPEGFYRINPERFHIRWRAKLLRNFAEAVYNSHVAAVLGVILDIVSGETELMSEQVSRAVSLHEINTYFDRLPASQKPDLSQTFSKQKLDSSWPPKRSRSSDFILATCEVLSGQDQWGMSTREMFLLQQGEGSHAKWSVNWSTLGRAMKRALVEAVIEEKLGKHAIRCWRILEAKGKLDEKHLARLAFLSVKDAREVLGRLSNAGFIEPQEIPRSADRAPSRTLYLWFVDFNKVVTALVGHHYKALANLQAQRAHQADKRKALVEKRERTDVRENEALLTKRDLEMIQELDQTMEALAVAEQRIDEQLFVLRELDPEPESL